MTVITRDDLDASKLYSTMFYLRAKNLMENLMGFLPTPKRNQYTAL